VDVLHSDTVIQPPTIPGPPVSTVMPTQVSAPDSAHSQLSQASYPTEASRPGAPAGGSGAAGGYGPPGGNGGPGGYGTPGGFGAQDSPWPAGGIPAQRGPDGDDTAGRPPGGGQHSETFAAWMSSALRREGLTQEAAARQLGVSVKTVSRWVGGATEPRMRDLRRIQELFGEVPIP
jgi:DNA-binding XRE family transcriptional regulator